MQTQIQVLLAAAAVFRLNTRSSIKVAKPQAFDRTTEKVSEFLTTYKLFIRMRMRDNSVEK